MTFLFPRLPEADVRIVFGWSLLLGYFFVRILLVSWLAKSLLFIVHQCMLAYYASSIHNHGLSFVMFLTRIPFSARFVEISLVNVVLYFTLTCVRVCCLHICAIHDTSSDVSLRYC